MNSSTQNSSAKVWIKEGLIWGAFMFIIMTFVYPLIHSDPITIKSILISIPVWGIAGLLYGYTTRAFFRRLRENRKVRG